MSAVMLKFRGPTTGLQLDADINKQGKVATLAWPIGGVTALREHHAMERFALLWMLVGAIPGTLIGLAVRGGSLDIVELNEAAPASAEAVRLRESVAAVLLGRPLTDIKAAYEARLKLWEEWQPVMDG